MKIIRRRTEISIETREIRTYSSGDCRCVHCGCGSVNPSIDGTGEPSDERRLLDAPSMNGGDAIELADLTQGES